MSIGLRKSTAHSIYYDSEATKREFSHFFLVGDLSVNAYQIKAFIGVRNIRIILNRLYLVSG